jgi:hypothetical protein
MVKAFGWRPEPKMTLPRHAGNIPGAALVAVLPHRCSGNADGSVTRPLSPGEGQGFSHWHFQSFAQGCEICIARSYPAAFPVINRHL